MLTNLAVILLIALAMTIFFTVLFRASGIKHGALFTFLIMLGATWLGDLWVRPVGPVIGNVYIFSVLFLPLLFGFLILAFHDSHRNISDLDEFEITREAAGIIGVFFWIFFLVMAFPIFAGYLF